MSSRVGRNERGKNRNAISAYTRENASKKLSEKLWRAKIRHFEDFKSCWNCSSSFCSGEISFFFYLCYASFRFEVSSMTYNASLLAIQDPVDCRKSAKQTSSCLLFTASGFDIAVILLTSGSSISPKTFKSLLC